MNKQEATKLLALIKIAYAAVAEILTHGVVVDYQTNWKNRGYDTAIVAAPIQIGTVEYMAGVVLKRTSMTNSFYVHEVAAIEKGALPFNQGHRAITQDGEPSGDTPSINSILQKILDVKKGNSTASGGADGILYQDRDVDSDGKQLSAGQQEYFKDSAVRDEKGRLMVMYHGTSNGGFTKFHSGTYFTSNPEYAAVYMNPGASSISVKRRADSPMTYKT